MTSLHKIATKLVKLGKAATPGPWKHSGHCFFKASTGDGLGRLWHQVLETDAATIQEADASFIAAARDSDRLAVGYLKAVEALKKMNAVYLWFNTDELDRDTQKHIWAAIESVRAVLAEWHDVPEVTQP